MQNGMLIVKPALKVILDLFDGIRTVQGKRIASQEAEVKIKNGILSAKSWFKQGEASQEAIAESLLYLHFRIIKLVEDDSYDKHLEDARLDDSFVEFKKYISRFYSEEDTGVNYTEELEDENSDFKDRIKFFEDENSYFQETIKRLELENKSLKDNVTSLEAELDKHEKDINDLTVVKDAYIKKLQVEIEGLLDERDVNNETISELRESLENSQQSSSSAEE